MNVHFKMAALLSTVSTAALLLLLAAPAAAEVFHSKQSAFAAAFPTGAEVEQVNVFLSDEDAAWIKSHAGVEWPGRLANVYVARKDGKPVAYGYFDTHKVRTLDETVLLVVRPDGHLEQVVQVAFHEPAEYRAPGRWLDQFRDRVLDARLSLKADIDGLSGATLTARAVTASVRAVLALHQRKFGASPSDTKG